MIRASTSTENRVPLLIVFIQLIGSDKFIASSGAKTHATLDIAASVTLGLSCILHSRIESSGY